MGIEKLYRDDLPNSTESIIIESYNKGQEAIKEIEDAKKPQSFEELSIEEKELGNGQKEFHLSKKNDIRYFYMNKNKRWRTFSDCYNHFLAKIINETEKKETYEVKSPSGYMFKLSYKRYIDHTADIMATKEWEADTKDGYSSIYAVEIKPEIKKQQIREIENHIGFGGWLVESPSSEYVYPMWNWENNG